MYVRNRLFDAGWLKVHTIPNLFVINVGNLRVGGTGKTPVTEMLIHILSPKFKMAVLSRGYGRKTKGFLEVKATDNSSMTGDEPLQICRKFKGSIKVFVCEDRVQGAQKLKEMYPDIQVLLLDDAYQHRYIDRQLNILLSAFSQPFYNDTVLPSGRLRESRYGAKRADMVFMTKCPTSLGQTAMEDQVKAIKRYTTADTIISWTGWKYDQLVGIKGENTAFPENALVITGIADPKDMLEHLKQKTRVIGHLKYPDHHNFSRKDIENIELWLREKKGNHGSFSIITTEKDMMRLQSEWPEAVKKWPICYLPARQVLLNQKENFEKRLIDTIIAKI